MFVCMSITLFFSSSSGRELSSITEKEGRVRYTTLYVHTCLMRACIFSMQLYTHYIQTLLCTQLSEWEQNKESHGPRCSAEITAASLMWSTLICCNYILTFGWNLTSYDRYDIWSHSPACTECEYVKMLPDGRCESGGVLWQHADGRIILSLQALQQTRNICILYFKL